MVGSNSTVLFMDIASEYVKEITLGELFNRYAEHVKYNANTATLAFDEFGKEGRFKVKDWRGWTDLLLLEMNRIVNPAEEYRLLESENGHHIVVTSDEMIPLYEVDDETKGFHGEVKHKYSLVYANTITDGYVREMVIDKGNTPYPTEFGKIMCKEYTGEKMTMVRVCTKSHFYNANGFNLCSWFPNSVLQIGYR